MFAFFLLAHVSKADETFLLDGTRAGPVVWSPALCVLDVKSIQFMFKVITVS